MTCEIVNLRQVRKQKARAAKEAQAEANRLRFGQSKAQRETTASLRVLQEKRFDGNRRTDDGASET